jgi:hypothetical protein
MTEFNPRFGFFLENAKIKRGKWGETMWQETIQIEGPYHFDRVLERHAIDPLKQVDLEKRSIKVPILIEKSPQVVQIIALGDK